MHQNFRMILHKSLWDLVVTILDCLSQLFFHYFSDLQKYHKNFFFLQRQVHLLKEVYVSILCHEEFYYSYKVYALEDGFKYAYQYFLLHLEL